MLVFEFLSGLAIGLSLIITIGAQNAFVIRQGMKGEHVVPVILTCAASDAVLIAAGIAGLKFLTQQGDWLVDFVYVLGMGFLLAYGAYHFLNAVSFGQALQVSEEKPKSLYEAIVICLALTWMNPHVYLETVFLIGSIATAYENRWIFGLGAAFASFLFFFLLGYSARFFGRLLTSRLSWRVIDILTSFVMWGVAYYLYLSWAETG